jgi:hypothetical protein
MPTMNVETDTVTAIERKPQLSLFSPFHMCLFVGVRRSDEEENSEETNTTEIKNRRSRASDPPLYYA